MVVKADQLRVKSLLIEAITNLCKSRLAYRTEFCIEGLLGITLDKNEIVLVNIKETVKSLNPNGSPHGASTLAPPDMMVLNGMNLNDVHLAPGEDLSIKNSSLTSTPGKKHNTSICSYLDKLDAEAEIKGDNNWTFPLNYALYDDVIEDLSMASGKRFQAISMDDLAVFDNDMGDIMGKDDDVENEESSKREETGKCLKNEALHVLTEMDHLDEQETLNLSMQEVISLATGSQSDDVLSPSVCSEERETPGPEILQVESAEMPLNLSEPKPPKLKKKYTCEQCKKSYKTENSLAKHKCKGTKTAGPVSSGGRGTSNETTTQPLDLTVTVGRFDDDNCGDGEISHHTLHNLTDISQEMSKSLLDCSSDLESEQRITQEAASFPVNVRTERKGKNYDIIGETSSIRREIDSKSLRQNVGMKRDDDDEMSMYTCICNKKLPDYDSYIQHQIQCTKSKQTPYKSCEECGKYLYSSSGYLKHKKLHKGAFRLACQICRKGFFDKTHLNNHVDATHSKVRRYDCLNCNNKFFWKHHLKRHQSTCGNPKAKIKKGKDSDDSDAARVVVKTLVGGPSSQVMCD